MKKWTLTLFVDVRCICSRNFSKDGRSYSYRAAIRYFVSENQGKVTCKISLCDNFLGLVFSAYRTTCSLHLHLQGANRSIQRKL